MGDSDKSISTVEILFKQSEELLSLRERSIQNLGGSTNTYFTVLGIIFTGITVLLESNGKLDCITLTEHFYLVVLGFMLVCYGIITRKNVWSFYINQIFYTRKLNLTRQYIIESRNISKKILLPIREDRPKFDQIGHLEGKFSKNSVVNWLKWINSVFSAILLYEFMFIAYQIPIINDFNKCIRFEFGIPQLIISIIFGREVFRMFNIFDKEIIAKAKKKWKKEIKHKEIHYKIEKHRERWL